MGVYIKNMNKPSKCNECYFNFKNYCDLLDDNTPSDSIDCRCPLVEVRTPHGRLIDADDYKKLLADDSKLWVLDHSPTVIEAEEE